MIFVKQNYMYLFQEKYVLTGQKGQLQMFIKNNNSIVRYI